MCQFFSSGGQSTGVSALASVLPMNIQNLFPLGLTGLIFMQSKGLSRVFSNSQESSPTPLFKKKTLLYLLLRDGYMSVFPYSMKRQKHSYDYL